jgi:hypothetical protein
MGLANIHWLYCTILKHHQVARLSGQIDARCDVGDTRLK